MSFRWIETNAPRMAGQGGRTDDIWFFDGQSGWLINSDGDALASDDGGNSWEHRLHLERGPQRMYLRCMGWASRDIGWIGTVTNGKAGYSKVILHHTTDGGHIWRAVDNLPSNVAAGICGFYAVNEQVAYGSGTNDPELPGPGIIKTTDGGKNWQFISMSEHATNLIDIYFENEKTGWVVGGIKDPSCPSTKPGFDGYPPYAQLKPVVLKTTDGGATWVNKAASVSDFNCGEWGWKIQFLPGIRVGFVVLEDLTGGGILRTMDGGESWSRFPITDEQGRQINLDLEGVGFLDPDQGWVGGWGHEFNGLQNSYTKDGGKTWVSENHVNDDPNSDNRVRINRYRFLGDPPTIGYCSGTTVYKLIVDGGEDLTRDLVSKGRVASYQGVKASDAIRQTDDGSSIELVVPDGSRHLSVDIWNHFAVHVRTLADRADPPPGRTTLFWDGKDDRGRQLYAGAYILRADVDGVGRSTILKYKGQ